MTELIEQVMTLETRPKVERKVKQVLLSMEEKAMLAKVAEVYEVDESEAMRRMIRATYEALVAKRA